MKPFSPTVRASSNGQTAQGADGHHGILVIPQDGLHLFVLLAPLVCRWIERGDELSGIPRALGRLARSMEQDRIVAIERLIQTADRFPTSLATLLI